MILSRAVLLAAITCVLVACDRPAVNPESSSLRIASFSPALTDMAQSLGLGDQIVGRSAFCRKIDPSLPVVGDLHAIDYELLVRVDPTHVLVQGDPAGVDPGLAELSAANGWELLVYRLDGVQDIRDAFENMPAKMLEAGTPQFQASMLVVRSHCEAIDAATARPIPSLAGQRVLLLSPMEPPLAWGTETWMGELLVRLGGTNAIAARGWTQLGWEDLLRIEADRIVLVSESPLSDEGRLQDMLDRRHSTIIDVLVHPQVHLPATSTPEIASRFRALLEQGGTQ
ncbi:MAG: ABC transporter substrate-binding protein [Phycisphaerales bacterium]|nr:ABC transporter substrate-binding protein [Phycisphaerales bacterium]